MAQVLRDMGYAAGQFGKNHLGDKEYMLPTNNGFDEFLGNLYHLNAEEEPENPDYPQDPAFREKFGPKGVIKSFADGRMEDTGPLTRKRMETIDDETLSAAMDFMERQVKADKPFFTWYNTTRMHVNTHVKDSNLGRSRLLRKHILPFAIKALKNFTQNTGSINSIASTLEISTRTLNNMFYERVGLAPKQYAMLIKLYALRDILLNKESSSITDAALVLNITDLGRFSARYKSLFGEYPSDTLKR
jgi:AraC-like DNA-binding protein